MDYWICFDPLVAAESSEMTPLHRILLDRIETTGPINMADYMAACLMDPEHGYYTTRTVFGSQGDFTTSPEISQMFGELIGLCLAQTWLDQGAPQEFALVELGPGRGTLLSDALRATSTCLLYTSPSPRDGLLSRMPSSA